MMYRDFATRKARNLELTGTVENMGNGSVFVVAEGDAGKLEEYLSQLKKGPIFARVERIEAKWFPATGALGDLKKLYYDRQD